jgi:hypothetical protein
MAIGGIELRDMEQAAIRCTHEAAGIGSPAPVRGFAGAMQRICGRRYGAS